MEIGFFIVVCVVMILAFVGSELALDHKHNSQKTNSSETSSQDET